MIKLAAPRQEVALAKESVMAKIKVTVESIDGYCNLPMLVGDYFYIDDSKLSVPEGKFRSRAGA